MLAVEKQVQQQFKVYIENMNIEHIIVKPFSARFRSLTKHFELYPGKRIVIHGRPLINKPVSVTDLSIYQNLSNALIPAFLLHTIRKH